MRNVNKPQAGRTGRRRLAQQGLRREHGIQQRQRQRHPRPRRNVRRGRCFFVMNMIYLPSLSDRRTAAEVTAGPLSSSAFFISKGSLLTIPSISDEKR